MNNLLLIFINALFIAGLVLSFYNIVYYSAITCIAAALFFLYIKKEMQKYSRVEKDALSFLEGVAKNSGIKPFSKRVLKSLKENYIFYKEVKEIVEKHLYSSYAGCEIAEIPYQSNCLTETLWVVTETLNKGVPSNEAIPKLLDKYRYLNELKMKHVGNITNSDAVLKSGTMIFFPIFAGIGKNIIGLNIVSGVSSNLSAFSMLIMAYLFVINLAISAHQKLNAKFKISNMVMQACIGIFVFNIAFMLGKYMI